MDIEKVSEKLCDELNQQTRANLDIHLACNACDRVAFIDSARSIESLIEHVMFEHPTRADVLVVRTELLIQDYEMALLLELPARTEHEERWRREQAAGLSQ